MILLRIDDVGRKPDDFTEEGTDHDLSYFLDWRERSGLRGKPVIYAATPKWIDASGRFRLGNLTGREIVAAHGYDHKRDRVHTLSQFQESAKWLDTTIYAPPFGKEHGNDLVMWNQAGGNTWLGGISGQDHERGDYPVFCNGLLTIPTCRDLVGRSSDILKHLRKYADHKAPFCCVGHVAWESSFHQVTDQLGPEHLCDLAYIKRWVHLSNPAVTEFTPSDSLAYRWVLSRLRPHDEVLDFGCRYSELPSLMSMRVARVSCWDRDKTFAVRQAGPCRKRGVVVEILEEPKGLYDVVTATWVIEHNEFEDIAALCGQLAKLVRPGGRLLVVGSFSRDNSWHREDQWVLNYPAWLDLVVRPTGMEVGDRQWFRYDADGVNYCEPNLANAMCLELTKV